jgi:uncharacterized protein YndB with AHSA1/START domain
MSKESVPMTRPAPGASTRTSRLIDAPREVVYRAFTDPASLVAWRAPDEMIGGGYEMSLFYPESEDPRGKTSGREDRYAARFVELAPPSRIVEAITFDSDDPAFAGEMIMEVTLEESDGQTSVTIAFANLPSGVRPEDNDVGTRSSLEKLARFVGAGSHPHSG